MDERERASGSEVASDPLAHSQPVILLGRGGSGTRLLAQLALSVGTFLGNELNSSQDSVEWVETLYDLAVEVVTIGVASGSARDLYWQSRLRRRASEILVSGRCDPNSLWGWKLPETMLVLSQLMGGVPAGAGSPPGRWRAHCGWTIRLDGSCRLPRIAPAASTQTTSSATNPISTTR